MNKKLLIIKTGHAEVFTECTSSEIISLGDVLRTSFILEFFPRYEITWFTSVEAKPLIDKNPSIKFIETELNDIRNQEYGLVINLEKNPIFDEFMGTELRSFGFYHDEAELKVSTANNGILSFTNFLTIVEHDSNSFQFKLCQLLGKTWSHQQYKLYNKSSENEKVTIGLNWKSGKKWPEKQLPQEFWDDLSVSFSESYILTFQEGFSDLAHYIKWINSCDTIITLDSLGLHIALSLEKKVIALFGPTNHKHVEMYNYGHKLCYDIENLANLKEQIHNLIEK
jgi:heptosyltransferase-2